MDKIGSRRVPQHTTVTAPKAQAPKVAPKPAPETRAAGWAARAAPQRTASTRTAQPAAAPVIADKAKTVAPAESHWYSGFTDTFSHASQTVQKSVNSAVTTAEAKVTQAATALSDAGHAVQNAGREVVSSAGKIVGASALIAGDAGKVVADAARTVRDAGAVVTGAGQAAFHAGKAALTGDPKELDAAKTSVTHARTAVADAKIALTDAGAQVKDAGKQVKVLGGAIDKASHALGHAEQKLEAAAGKINESIAAVVSAPAQVARGVQRAVTEGGKEVRQAIEKIPGGKEMLQGAERLSQGGKKVAIGLATGNPLQVAKGLAEEATGVVDFGKGVAHSPVVPWAKEKLVDYANGFNPEKQVAELKPGQSYTLKLGAGAHVEFGAEAKGTLSVKAEKDGSFTVDASAVAGVNVRAEAEKVGKQGEEAVAHALLGGKAQFKCANQADAVKLTKILEKAAAAASNPVMAPLVGMTKDDLSFLKSHASSVEVSGQIAAQLGIDMHVPGLAKHAGVKLEGGASVQRAVRIDLKDGKPVGLTLSDEVALELSGGVGVKLPPQLNKATGEHENRDTSKGLSGKIGGKLTLETHVELPKNISLDDLVTKPHETLARYGVELAKSKTESVAVGLEGEGKVGVPLLNKSGSFAADFKLTRKGGPVDGATINKLLHGDLAGAAGDGGVELEGSARTVDKKKWGGEDMGLSIAGVGVDLTAYAEKTTESPPFFEAKVSHGMAE